VNILPLSTLFNTKTAYGVLTLVLILSCVLRCKKQMELKKGNLSSKPHTLQYA